MWENKKGKIPESPSISTTSNFSIVSMEILEKE